MGGSEDLLLRVAREALLLVEIQEPPDGDPPILHGQIHNASRARYLLLGRLVRENCNNEAQIRVHKKDPVIRSHKNDAFQFREPRDDLLRQCVELVESNRCWHLCANE